MTRRYASRHLDFPPASHSESLRNGICWKLSTNRRGRIDVARLPAHNNFAKSGCETLGVAAITSLDTSVQSQQAMPPRGITPAYAHRSLLRFSSPPPKPLVDEMLANLQEVVLEDSAIKDHSKRVQTRHLPLRTLCNTCMAHDTGPAFHAHQAGATVWCGRGA